MPGVYSVTQINTYIKNLFSRDFSLRSVTVRGEVSNCKYHTAGHIYFTLKDQTSAISCVMFQSNRQELSFRLADGMQIDASGQVSVYEKTGSYQLYVRTAKAAGQGELYERFLKLKQELSERGWFDPGYKKPVPKFCMKVGIVTSDTGAAIRDIVNVSKRRNPYAQLFLMPALVQGERAAQDIADSIRRIDAMGMDVLIVGRGGGSIEDLWPFNEEIVADAIFDCVTPVISAVGHETDFTIADFVADLRAPTPSAAAELANFDYGTVCEQLSHYEARLGSLLQYRLQVCAEKKRALQSKLDSLHPAEQIRRMKLTGDDREKRLRLIMDGKLAAVRNTHSHLSGILENSMNTKLLLTKERMGALAGRLDALSPLKKLTGGFGYVSVNGKAVKSAGDVRTGDILSARFSDGTVKAAVTAVER